MKIQDRSPNWLWLWRPDFCPGAVRFKTFLPLTFVKNKLCALPPDSLSSKRLFTLTSLPLLIHKWRIYNPIFKTRSWNWKGKFPPSPTRLIGYTLTAVSRSGWPWTSHQAIGIHRLKILSPPLSSSTLSKSVPEQKRESHSLLSDTMERKNRRAQSIPSFHYLAYTQTQWWQDFLVAWTRLKTSTCLASAPCILALMSTDAFFFSLMRMYHQYRQHSCSWHEYLCTWCQLTSISRTSTSSSCLKWSLPR